MKDHYDSFGLNIFAPASVLKKTNEIFGDEDLRSEWRDDHDQPNVGCNGWVCFASFSEYDFLFVCVDASQSSHYGTIRRCVNNCNEDEPIHSAEFLVESIKKYLAARKQAKAVAMADAEPDEDPDDIEFDDPHFGGFLASCDDDAS